MINSNQNYHALGGPLNYAFPSNVHTVPFDPLTLSFNKGYLDPTFLQGGSLSLAQNLIDEIHRVNKNFQGLKKGSRRLRYMFLLNVLYCISIFVIFFLGGYTMQFYLFVIGGLLILKMVIINIYIMGRFRSKMLRRIPKIENRINEVINIYNISFAPFGIRAQFRRELNESYNHHHHHHGHGVHGQRNYSSRHIHLMMYIDFFKLVNNQVPQEIIPQQNSNFQQHGGAVNPQIGGVANPQFGGPYTGPGFYPQGPNLASNPDNFREFQQDPRLAGNANPNPIQNQFNYNNHDQFGQAPRYG